MQSWSPVRFSASSTARSTRRRWRMLKGFRSLPATACTSAAEAAPTTAAEATPTAEATATTKATATEAAAPIDRHPAPAVPAAPAAPKHREEGDRRGEDQEQPARRVAPRLLLDGLRRRGELDHVRVAELDADGLRALHDGPAHVTLAQQRD